MLTTVITANEAENKAPSTEEKKVRVEDKAPNKNDFLLIVPILTFRIHQKELT